MNYAAPVPVATSAGQRGGHFTRARLRWLLIAVGMLVFCSILVSYSNSSSVLSGFDVNFVLSHIVETPEDQSAQPIAPVATNEAPVAVENNDEEAYVFVITNDKGMHLLWALESSFRNVSTTRRRVVLATSAVTQATREVIANLSIEVREVPNIRHPRYNTNQPRWKDTLSKVNLWDEKVMAGIKKFVYLDVDFMLNDNMDYLFDLDTSGGKLHAMADNHGCHMNMTTLNAGLFVASPNTTVKDQLLAALDEPNNPTKGTGDQDLFNYYFTKHKILYLRPEMEMAFVWRCICMWKGEIPKYDHMKVKAIHFTGWWIDYPYLIRHQTSERSTDPCVHQVYVRWLWLHNNLRSWWEEKFKKPMPSFYMAKM